MRREGVVFAALVGVTVLAGPAYAARPVAAPTRHVDIELEAAVVEDSNVARGDATEAALRGISPHDTIYTPTVLVDVFLPVSRQSLFLTGDAGYNFHDKNTKLDRSHANLTGGINGRFGPCDGQLALSYARAGGDLQTTLVLLDPRNILETERANLQGTCGRRSGLAMTFGGSVERGNNSNKFEALLNHNSYDYSLGLVYRRPTFGSLSVFGDYRRIDYPNQSLALQSQSGFEIQAVGVSYERRVGSRLSAKLSASETNLKPLSSAGAAPRSKFSGATYSADLSYRATSRLTLDLEHTRDVRPSVNVGALYNIETDTSANATYRIGSRLRLQAHAATGQVDPRGVPAGLAGTILTKSRVNTGGVSLRYQQSRRLAIQADLSREDRKTNLTRFNYTSDRVGVTASLRF